MTRTQKAVDLYRQRFTCSQAIFTAFRQPEQLDEQTALKLGTVFAAGVACRGDGLCGAVSGALLAISMKHGRGSVEDLEAKARTYELGRRFMDAFEKANGSCICERILGVNIGTPEGLQKAQEARLFETRCLDAVKSAAAILEQMI